MRNFGTMLYQTLSVLYELQIKHRYQWGNIGENLHHHFINGRKKFQVFKILVFFFTWRQKMFKSILVSRQYYLARAKISAKNASHCRSCCWRRRRCCCCCYVFECPKSFKSVMDGTRQQQHIERVHGALWIKKLQRRNSERAYPCRSAWLFGCL